MIPQILTTSFHAENQPFTNYWLCPKWRAPFYCVSIIIFPIGIAIKGFNSLILGHPPIYLVVTYPYISHIYLLHIYWSHIPYPMNYLILIVKLSSSPVTAPAPTARLGQLPSQSLEPGESHPFF